MAKRRRQLNLFVDATPVPGPRSGRGPETCPLKTLEEQDDQALIASLLESSMTQGPLIAAELGRRQCADAVPALEAYCQRFAPLGAQQAVREQVAALRALGEIGGRAAVASVTRLVSSDFVRGSTRDAAVDVAAHLGCRLPSPVVRECLQSSRSQVRLNACVCAPQSPDLRPVLTDCLTDPSEAVRVAAARILGRMGEQTARPVLMDCLRSAPSEDIIDAIGGIADEDVVTLLGRIATAKPDLADVARDALEMSSHPKAAHILARIGTG